MAIAEESGRVLPGLLDEPELDPYQGTLLAAWWLLSAGRPVAVGQTRAFAMHLPAGDCLALAGECGVDPLDFLRLCRTLDALYLAHVNK